MKILVDEIVRRFPEMRPHLSEGDEDLPYLVMNELADWLKSLLRKAFTPILTQRLKSFADWCEDQPRGDSAADDLLTIFVVGFFEHLFDSEKTRSLVPNFMPRERYIENAEYLIQWVGKENYDRVLEYYKGSN
jgi:hypothetical protein